MINITSTQYVRYTMNLSVFLPNNDANFKTQ